MSPAKYAEEIYELYYERIDVMEKSMKTIQEKRIVILLIRTKSCAENNFSNYIFSAELNFESTDAEK